MKKILFTQLVTMSNLTPPTAAVLIRSLSSILTYDKELKPTELKPKTSVILNLII